MRELGKDYEERPLTVYLGESGSPHDTKRIDIIPSLRITNNRRLSVSVDNTGVVVTDLDTQATLVGVVFNELENK